MTREMASGDVLEAFGTWFADLRQRMRQRRQRGHSNPCMVLDTHSGLIPSQAQARQGNPGSSVHAIRPPPATDVNQMTQVVEVVDIFSHLTRLEDLRRSALEASETQWRTFMSRNGSLPRGPAATAVRLHRQLAAAHESISALINEEAIEREVLQASRVRWMREAADRARCELEALAMFVMREWQRRILAECWSKIALEEQTHRVSLMDSAQAWLHRVATSAQAHLAQLQSECQGRAAASELLRRCAGDVIASELRSREAIGEAEENQRRCISDAFSQRMAALQAYVSAALQAGWNSATCQAQMRRTVAMDEAHARDQIVRAELAYMEDIATAFRKQCNHMKRSVHLRMQAANDASTSLQQHFVDMLEEEKVQRVRVAEAWLRWLNEVVEVRAVQGLSNIRRYAELATRDLQETERYCVALTLEESRVRKQIESSRWDWLRLHFVPLESLERTDLPRLAEELRLQRLAESDRLHCSWLSSPMYHILRDESQFRSQITFGETKWRNELGHRFEKLLDLWRSGDGRWLRQFCELEYREGALRSAMVDSETRWREQTMALLQMRIAREAALTASSQKQQRGKKTTAVPKSSVF